MNMNASLSPPPGELDLADEIEDAAGLLSDGAETLYQLANEALENHIARQRDEETPYERTAAEISAIAAFWIARNLQAAAAKLKTAIEAERSATRTAND